MSDFVPVNQPLFGNLEKKYLAECIDTGWVSSEGHFVERLESGLAKRMERSHGIAVANGTAALDIALKALRIGPADEVILPSFTIISCASSVTNTGAKPVFVDADPTTWNMDVTQVADKITRRTRAIMAVHIYGLPVDMDPILQLAKQHGLAVIEDAAEAIGQTYKGRPCGSFGTLSTLSFYPNKHITTGEGGMVLTNDAQLADRCRSLRNLCFQEGKRFVHEEIGWNYRMSNLQAAVGVAQLECLDEHLSRKRRIGQIYSEQLSGLPYTQLPLPSTDYADNLFWVYGLVLKEDSPHDAPSAIASLARAGIGCRNFFWPMHEQPVFRSMDLVDNYHLPVAEQLARRGFYIPSGLALTSSQQQRVTDALWSLFQ